MTRNKNPLLSDDFLDELAIEINELYGLPSKEQVPKENTKEIDQQNSNNMQE